MKFIITRTSHLGDISKNPVAPNRVLRYGMRLNQGSDGQWIIDIPDMLTCLITLARIVRPASILIIPPIKNGDLYSIEVYDEFRE